MRIIVAAVVVAALSAIAAPAPRAQSSSAGPAPELTALDYVQIRQLVARVRPDDRRYERGFVVLSLVVGLPNAEHFLMSLMRPIR
jgi:hypothetical protein